jgi:amino-acid N-acetyltransferase
MYSILNAAQVDLKAINLLLSAENLPVVEANEMAPYYFKVQTKDNIKIGAIGLELYGKFGLLRSLVVDKNHRDNGIANLLITEVFKVAQKLDLFEMYLLTTTADKYFLKKGFKIVSRNETPDEIKSSKEFSSLCPISSIIMNKKLS